MEHELVAWLASDSGYKVHIGIFVMLILGGFGFPIPEDIPILLGGASAAKGIISTQAAFFTCYLGVLIADQFMYLAGFLFGPKLVSAGTKSKFLPALTEERVAKVREGLRKHRLTYIFIGRHLFPLRSVTFLSAGALHIPFFEFFIADALAALVSVSLIIALGYWLGLTLGSDVIQHIANDAHKYIIIVVALAGIFYLVRRIFRKSAFNTKKSNEADFVEFPPEYLEEPERKQASTSVQRFQ